MGEIPTLEIIFSPEPLLRIERAPPVIRSIQNASR
jgi:hypothetical protein